MRTASALQLGAERAADAAIGAGGQDRAGGDPVRGDGFLDQRRGRAGLDAGAAGHAVGVEEVVRREPGRHLLSKPRPSIVSAKVPWTSSQARTQREQTMHFDASNWK